MAMTKAITTGDQTTRLSRKLKLMTPVPKLAGAALGLGEGAASSRGPTKSITTRSPLDPRAEQAERDRQRHRQQQQPGDPGQGPTSQHARAEQRPAHTRLQGGHAHRLDAAYDLQARPRDEPRIERAGRPPGDQVGLAEPAEEGNGHL